MSKEVSNISDPAIKSILEDFHSWRENRVNKREVIPDYLWNKVVSLTNKYKPGKLCSLLRLNQSALKEHMVKDSGIVNKKAKQEFIDVSTLECRNNDCKIELTNALGEEFNIHINHKAALPYVDFIKTFLSRT
jgi:hypothetical protein